MSVLPSPRPSHVRLLCSSNALSACLPLGLCITPPCTCNTHVHLLSFLSPPLQAFCGHISKVAPPHLPASTCIHSTNTKCAWGPHLILLTFNAQFTFKTITFICFLSSPLKHQLRGDRNFYLFHLLLHPQHPAQHLAHSGCSITLCQREGIKRGRERRGILVSSVAFCPHYSTESVPFSTPHAEIPTQCKQKT